MQRQTLRISLRPFAVWLLTLIALVGIATLLIWLGDVPTEGGAVVGQVEASVIAASSREQTVTLRVPRSYVFSPITVLVELRGPETLDYSKVRVPYDHALLRLAGDKWTARLAMIEATGYKLAWVEFRAVTKITIAEEKA